MLEAEGIQTHFVEMLSDIDMLVKKVEIIKIEVIVRNIAAGSITKKYPMKEGIVFKPPVLVFDFKSDEYGDPMLNDDIALALELATREELAILRKLALRVNELLVPYLDEKVSYFLISSWSSEEGMEILSLQTRFPATPAGSGTRRQGNPWIKMSSGLTKAIFPKLTRKLPGV